jgi:hypothetical protein
MSVPFLLGKDLRLNVIQHARCALESSQFPYEARPNVIFVTNPHTRDYSIPPVFAGHNWKNEYRSSMARKANKTSGASASTKKDEKVEDSLKKMRQRQEEMIQEKQRQAKEKKDEATNKQNTVTTSAIKQRPKKQEIQKSVGWLMCGPDTSLLPFEKEAVEYLYGPIRDTKRLESAISECQTFEDTQYYTEASEYYTEDTRTYTEDSQYYTEYTDDNTKHTFGDMTLASSKEPNLITHGFMALGELLSGDFVEEPKPPRHRRAVAEDPPKHRRVVPDDPPKQKRVVADDPPKQKRVVADDPPKQKRIVADDPPKQKRVVADDPPKHPPKQKGFFASSKSVDYDNEEEEEAKNTEGKTGVTKNDEQKTEVTKNYEVKPKTALSLNEEIPSLTTTSYASCSNSSREEDDEYEGQFLEEFFESEAISSSSGVELSLLRKVTRIEI